MYLERRTRPSANHIVTQKIEDEAMRRHRAALHRVQPQVDDRPPPRQRHLQQNAKKMVQLEERYLEIERDNLQLLARMHEMMKKGHADDKRRSRKPHSLNIARRRKELSRITRENQALLARIQQSRPTYSDVDFRRHAKESRKLAKQVSEFSNGRRGTSRPASRSSSRPRVGRRARAVSARRIRRGSRPESATERVYTDANNAFVPPIASPRVSSPASGKRRIGLPHGSRPSSAPLHRHARIPTRPHQVATLPTLQQHATGRVGPSRSPRAGIQGALPPLGELDDDDDGDDAVARIDALIAKARTRLKPEVPGSPARRSRRLRSAAVAGRRQDPSMARPAARSRSHRPQNRPASSTGRRETDTSTHPLEEHLPVATSVAQGQATSRARETRQRRRVRPAPVSTREQAEAFAREAMRQMRDEDAGKERSALESVAAEKAEDSVEEKGLGGAGAEEREQTVRRNTGGVSTEPGWLSAEEHAEFEADFAREFGNDVYEEEQEQKQQTSGAQDASVGGGKQATLQKLDASCSGDEFERLVERFGPPSAREGRSGRPTSARRRPLSAQVRGSASLSARAPPTSTRSDGSPKKKPRPVTAGAEPGRVGDAVDTDAGAKVAIGEALAGDSFIQNDDDGNASDASDLSAEVEALRQRDAAGDSPQGPRNAEADDAEVKDGADGGDDAKAGDDTAVKEGADGGGAEAGDGDDEAGDDTEVTEDADGGDAEGDEEVDAAGTQGVAESDDVGKADIRHAADRPTEPEGAATGSVERPASNAERDALSLSASESGSDSFDVDDAF